MYAPTLNSYAAI